MFNKSVKTVLREHLRTAKNGVIYRWRRKGVRSWNLTLPRQQQKEHQKDHDEEHHDDHEVRGHQSAGPLLLLAEDLCQID
jgi:hypothetical protein